MYCLTDDNTRFDKGVAMQLYTSILHPRSHFPAPKFTVKGHGVWTGKQLFSCLLPTSLCFDGKGILIQNGQLLRGQMSDKILGSNSNGLIHVLSRWPLEFKWSIDSSLEFTQQFISEAQRMGLAFFAHRGFSVGIKDCIIKPSILASIAENLETGMKNAENEYTTATASNSIVSTQFKAVEASKREMNILAHLEQATTTAGALVRDEIARPASKNNIHIMLASGAKGKASNVMQMSACVGQQIINGQRPLMAFGLTQRTLPIYSAVQSRQSPTARGFIPESFTNGLSVASFFAAAQGGREGMTDTSVKTQVSVVA